MLQEHLSSDGPPSTLQLETAPAKAGRIVRRGAAAILETDGVSIHSASVLIGAVQENFGVTNGEVAIQFVTNTQFYLDVGLVDEMQAQEQILVKYGSDRTRQTLDLIAFKVTVANSPPELYLLPNIGARGSLNLTIIIRYGSTSDGILLFFIGGHSLKLFHLLGFKTLPDQAVSLLKALELLPLF